MRKVKPKIKKTKQKIHVIHKLIRVKKKIRKDSEEKTRDLQQQQNHMFRFSKVPFIFWFVQLINSLLYAFAFSVNPAEK